MAVVYAVTIKIRRRQKHNVVLMLLGGFVAVFNAAIMYCFFNGITPSWTLRSMQQVLSSMIVPIAYMYFSSQMGKKLFNSVSLSLLALMTLLLLPSAFFMLDGRMPVDPVRDIAPMMFYFFYQGREVGSAHTADMVIMFQSFITLWRLVSIVQMVRLYQLTVSSHVRYFLFWWGAAILFIIFTSTHTTKEFADPMMQSLYFISYSILMVSIYYLLSLDLDLRLRMLNADEAAEEMADEEMADEEMVDVEEQKDMEDEILPAPVFSADAEGLQEPATIIEDIDSFVLHSRVMAQQVRNVMDTQRYLDPTLCIDDMARLLGTNRTYFCRMVKAEFDCTFSELLVKYRVEYARHQLLNPEYSIKDVSVNSGFGTEKSFARRFTQYYGITPQKWREQNRRTPVEA